MLIATTQLPQTPADLFSSFKGVTEAIKYEKCQCNIHRNDEQLSQCCESSTIFFADQSQLNVCFQGGDKFCPILDQFNLLYCRHNYVRESILPQDQFCRSSYRSSVFRPSGMFKLMSVPRQFFLPIEPDGAGPLREKIVFRHLQGKTNVCLPL